MKVSIDGHLSRAFPGAGGCRPTRRSILRISRSRVAGRRSTLSMRLLWRPGAPTTARLVCVPNITPCGSAGHGHGQPAVVEKAAESGFLPDGVAERRGDEAARAFDKRVLRLGPREEVVDESTRVELAPRMPLGRGKFLPFFFELEEHVQSPDRLARRGILRDDGCFEEAPPRMGPAAHLFGRHLLRRRARLAAVDREAFAWMYPEKPRNIPHTAALVCLGRYSKKTWSWSARTTKKCR